MPSLKDLLKGLKLSGLVTLLFIFGVITIYTASNTIYTINHTAEYVGVRLMFLTGFFALATFIVAHQTGKAFKSYQKDEEVNTDDAILSTQILIIGGIGITLIALSIYDLLSLNNSRALVESPIGVVTVVAAIQLWLAKTPKQEQHKLLNGAGTIVLVYVLFLAALVPFTGLATYFFYPETHGNWASWATFLLPAIAGAWYIFRLPTKKPKGFRQY